MKNLSMFCLTLNPDHEKIIKNLSYIPVGLGKKNFSKECFSDKTGLNISQKTHITVSILFTIGFGKIT